MTNALQIRVDDPALAGDLIDYLRRCDCRAEPAGPGALRVELDVDPRSHDSFEPLPFDQCYGCLKSLEPGIRGFGSLYCLDCRDGLTAHIHGSRRFSTFRVAAFLRVWEALHPGVRATAVEQTYAA